MIGIVQYLTDLDPYASFGNRSYLLVSYFIRLLTFASLLSALCCIVACFLTRRATRIHADNKIYPIKAIQNSSGRCLFIRRCRHRTSSIHYLVYGAVQKVPFFRWLEGCVIPFEKVPRSPSHGFRPNIWKYRPLSSPTSHAKPRMKYDGNNYFNLKSNEREEYGRSHLFSWSNLQFSL